MSMIRVWALPVKCTEKQLKIYFSKPENGGGPIKNIYYPLLNNSAVIEYENEESALMVKSHACEESEGHKILGQDVVVWALPNMIYGKIVAEIDSEVSSFLQATDDLRDDIQYNGNVEYCLDEEKNIIGIRGNWYELEWAWSKIFDFMQHQSFIQKHVAHRIMARKQAEVQSQGVGKGGKKSQQTTSLERQQSAEEKPIERQSSKNKAFSKSVRGAEGGHQHGANSPMSQHEDDGPTRSQYGQHQSSPHGYPVSPSSGTEGEDSFSRYRSQQSYNTDSDDDIQPGSSTRPAQPKGKAVTKKNPGDPKMTTDKSRQRYGYDETDTDDEIEEAKASSRRHVEVTAEMNDARGKGKAGVGATKMQGRATESLTPTGQGKDIRGGDRDERKPTADNRYESSEGHGIQIIKNNPDDVKSLKFTYGPLTVDVYVGWITMEETEAIVNAAMGPLIHAGGVARAIAVAAGPELERQCEEYVKTNGSVQTTQVMHSCAGGSLHANVKHVIHAVGPIWPKEAKQGDAENCVTELTNTFLNAFLFGNNVLNITSVAVPLISSGIFGCPLELCVRSFLSAVLLFPAKISESSGSGNIVLRRIHLVNNDDISTANTVVTMRQLIEGGPEPILATAERLQQQYDVTAARRGTALLKSSGSKLTQEIGLTSQRAGMSSQGVDRMPGHSGMSSQNTKMSSPGAGMTSHGMTSQRMTAQDMLGTKQKPTFDIGLSSKSGSSRTKKKGPPTESYLSVMTQQQGLAGSTGSVMTSTHCRQNPSIDVSGVPDVENSFRYGTTSGRALPSVPMMTGTTSRGSKPKK